MAWRIVVQPNGKYARFSDIVDNFTDYDMTREEAFLLCRDIAGVQVANEKIERAENSPGRFADEIETIREIHGDKEAESILKEMSQ